MTELRRISPDEWATWRDMRLRSLADTPDAYGSTLQREAAYDEAEWRTRLEGGRAILVFEDGAPVAMGAAWRPDEERFDIVAMWVVPEFRGRGFSRLVLQELVSMGRSEGRRIGLCVTRGNDVARSAYEKFGFVDTGTSDPLREGSDLLVDHLVLPG